MNEKQPETWDLHQRICDLPLVDEAMRNLIDDPNNDNAVCLVRAVREAVPIALTVEPTEVPLNIIRWWPDGMAAELERMWKGLVGYIPNYKLYDLQRLLARHGYVMKLYHNPTEAAQPAIPPSWSWDWTMVDQALPPVNTEVLIALDRWALPATGQYTGRDCDKERDGWCYPEENRNIHGGWPKVKAWALLPEVPQ